METKTLIMDESAMNRAIVRISFEILERNRGAENICVVGIISRGVEIATRIAKKIEEVEGKKIDVGTLDITNFRDDVEKRDNSDKTDISFNITDKQVILVDDVIYTGRSVRAAIDALMERGRPRKIELAVLVDRGHRELPIRPDFVGKNLPTSNDEKVKVMVLGKDGEDKVIITKGDK